MNEDKTKMVKTGLDKQAGITLIALVITIIMLLILASVSISSIIGENGGVKEQAEKAVNAYNERSEEESEVLNEVKDVIGPDLTIQIVATPTTLTNGKVKIEIGWSSKIEGLTKQYSTDGTDWYTYTGPFEVEENCIVYARLIAGDNNIKKQSSRTIANIDRTPPTVSLIKHLHPSLPMFTTELEFYTTDNVGIVAWGLTGIPWYDPSKEFDEDGLFEDVKKVNWNYIETATEISKILSRSELINFSLNTLWILDAAGNISYKTTYIAWPEGTGT